MSINVFSSKSSVLNSLFIHNQFLEDTKTTNRDGFGIFFDRQFIAKSKNDAQIITNFGDYFNTRITTNDPIIGHVRFATATNGKKTIEAESSHPFEGEKLVLAHNGVLEFKDIKNMDRHKDATVDSVIFLRELESIYNGENLVEALQKTMELFNGTFAFMIYSKLEKAYFIVRGKTKKLHISYTTFGENLGFVVNTDYLDLDRALVRFKAITEITQRIKFDYSKPIEIKEDGIFKVDLESAVLDYIGEIKETEKDKVFFTGESISQRTITNVGGVGNKSYIEDVAKKLSIFLSDFKLSYYEFDVMINAVTENSLLGETVEDIERLLETFESLRTFQTDKKSELWRKITAGFENPMHVYYLWPQLKFPYMMNGKKALEMVLDLKEKTI